MENKQLLSLQQISVEDWGNTPENVKHLVELLMTDTIELESIGHLTQLPSDRHYLQMIQAQTDLILRSLPDTTITFANDAVCLALGQSLKDIIGLRWSSFVPPKQADEINRKIAELTPDSPTFENINQDYRSDNEIGWTQWINFGIFDDRGQLLEIQSVGRDITALQQQIQQEQSLNRVFQAIRNSLDLDTIFATVTAETAKLLKTMDCFVVKYFPEQGIWRHVAEFRHNLDTPTVIGFEIPDTCNPFADRLKQLQIVRVDNTTNLDNAINLEVAQILPRACLLIPLIVQGFLWGSFMITTSKQPFTWIDNQVELAQVIAGQLEIAIYQANLYQQVQLELEERRRVETALQQAKEAAESANRAKSIFLSNMSHELRTPLNSILGFTQLMLNEDSLSPSSQERLQIVNRSGEYLLDLINDILDLSKIESGRMTLNNSEFDLKKLLNSIEEMLRVKVQSREVMLIFEQDPNLPTFIHTDQKKLYQVLVNLLGNAIKFTKQGSIILRVNVESADDTSCNLYFEIEDTGVGIAPEEIDNLFKAFVQAQAGNNLNQGTGLGLAISQKIIQLMDSQIHVKSTLNQGSTFSFNIEVQLPEVAIFTSEPLNQKVIGLAPNQPIYRILVVEDSAENRLLLVGILTTIGFEVREAADGIEAIVLWESWSPHLILMDLRMPLMDGYTAIKHIRENSKSQETMIIVLTASVFEEDRDKVLTIGCNDFIRKPFQQKELFEKIAHHLGVQYCYETIEESAQKSSVELLSVEALSEMSPQWLEDLYQAAYYLDTDVMNELIDQIPTSNASLSKALTDSIDNFNCDRILELIRSLDYLGMRI